jgi:hypothetical protein
MTGVKPDIYNKNRLPLLDNGAANTFLQSVSTRKYCCLDFPIYLQSVEIHSANGVLGGEGG